MVLARAVLVVVVVAVVVLVRVEAVLVAGAMRVLAEAELVRILEGQNRQVIKRIEILEIQEIREIWGKYNLELIQNQIL
jgi:hypothetical protein